MVRSTTSRACSTLKLLILFFLSCCRGVLGCIADQQYVQGSKKKLKNSRNNSKSDREEDGGGHDCQENDSSMRNTDFYGHRGYHCRHHHKPQAVAFFGFAALPHSLPSVS